MTASHVQTPAARKAATSQQATLDALASTVASVVGGKLGEMATRMSAALADVSEPGLDTREVYRRIKSARLLKDNGYAFVHLAGDAIERAVRAELDVLRPASAQRQPAAALSLVPLADIDDRLAFTALARPFDIEHADQLATLSVRLGLLLGRGLLRADGNPFRPAVFLKALDDAWREFEPDAEAHGLLLGVLKPAVVFDFGPLIEQLIAVLQRKDSQPGSIDALRIQKTDDAAAAKAARAGSRAALAKQLRALFGDDGGEDGVPLIPELAGMPSGNGGWRPSGATGFLGAPVPEKVAVADPAGGGAVGVATPAGMAPAPGTAASQHGAQMATGFVNAPAGSQMAQGFVAAPGGPQMAMGFVPAHGGMPAAAGFVAAQAGMAATGGFAGTGGEMTSGVAAPAGPAHAQGAGVTAAQWAGLPVQGLVAAASGVGGAMPMPAGVGASAPLLDLLARMEPVLAANAAHLDHVGHGTDAPAAGVRDGSGKPLAHNVFYLPRLQQSLPRGSLSRGDEHTLDLLARVFETVLQDDSIPAKARELLQALQVPVLKAALLDKQFFFEESHPARRMVDLVSRMGWAQHKESDDPVFQAMQRSVAQVVQDSGAQDAAGEGFAAAVAGLEASLAQEDSAQEQALAAPVASALKQEKMALATRAAQDAVALRVGTPAADGAHAAGGALGLDDGAIVAVVSGFLEQRWTTVLTFAYSIEDDKPGAVGNATRAMDDLIWSVKPKATQEQRRDLIKRLPRLLATLNKWLDAIRWQDAERLEFFARLAEYHAAIVRAPIELSPERQLELAVEAAQRDALRRIEMETAAAAQEQARAEAISPVDGLERGMWCEFRSGEEARKVKLAWVSPLRTLFIFSGAGRREAFSMTAEKLADALHAGAARVLALEGVVGQVLMAAMAGGADNDAAMQVPATR